MTVNITISNQTGGNALPDSVDMGSVAPSGETGVQDLFIRHDASVNKITDCSFYMTRFTGSGYLGADADADYLEVIGWADEAYINDPNSPEGFIINQNAPSFDSSYDESFRTNYGDINQQIILSEDAIVIGSPENAGEIPVAGEAHVQVRVKVPDSVPAGANYRAIELVMAYSATS